MGTATHRAQCQRFVIVLLLLLSYLQLVSTVFFVQCFLRSNWEHLGHGFYQTSNFIDFCDILCGNCYIDCNLSKVRTFVLDHHDFVPVIFAKRLPFEVGVGHACHFDKVGRMITLSEYDNNLFEFLAVPFLHTVHGKSTLMARKTENSMTGCLRFLENPCQGLSFSSSYQVCYQFCHQEITDSCKVGNVLS